MSNCIKELYNYGLVKKCAKCGIISIKSTFHRDTKRKDELFSQCKFCRKIFEKKL